MKTSTTLPPSTTRHLRRLASRIHQLGPRPLFELLCEIGHEADPLRRIEAYAALDSNVVRLLGGSDFPSVIRRGELH
jgi:hypothetical protein